METVNRTVQPGPESRPPVLSSISSGSANTGHDRLDYSQLDPGIVLAVRILRDAGVVTMWSCQGGEGHGYRHPTVIFRGDAAEAARVVDIARRAHLAPLQISRIWNLADGQVADFGMTASLVGNWRLEFTRAFPPASHDSKKEAQQVMAEAASASTDSGASPTEEAWNELVHHEPRLQQKLNLIVGGNVTWRI